MSPNWVPIIKPSEKAFLPKRIMPRFELFFKNCFVCLFVCVQARKPLSAFGREGRHRLKRPGDNSRRVRRGKLMKLLGNLCGSEHLCDCQQEYLNHLATTDKCIFAVASSKRWSSCETIRYFLMDFFSQH